MKAIKLSSWLYKTAFWKRTFEIFAILSKTKNEACDKRIKGMCCYGTTLVLYATWNDLDILKMT